MRIYLFIGIILLLFTLLLFGTGRQVYLWLQVLKGSIKPLTFALIFGILWIFILGLFIYGRVPNNPLPRIVHSFTHYAVGFFAYLAMFFLLLGFLLFIAKTLLPLLPESLTKTRLYAGSLALILVFGFFLYGIYNGKKLSVTSYTVEVEKGSSVLDSLRIAMISDLHLGYMIGEKQVEQITREINKLQPDLVLFAGDIFDGDITSIDNPEKIQQLFRELKSTYGTYAVFGNHDAGSSYEDMVSFLKDAKIHLLRDEYQEVKNSFILLGRRDSSPIGKHGKDREPVKDFPQNSKLPVIVLDHQPGNIHEYGSEVDLILSGHTHKGQLFPFHWITAAVYDVDYGYFRKDEKAPQVIVSSGVGTWGPPLRTSSRNEIVLLELKLKDKTNK